MPKSKRPPLTPIAENAALGRATTALMHAAFRQRDITVQDLGPDLFLCGGDNDGKPFAALGLSLQRRVFELTSAAPWKMNALTSLVAEALKMPITGAPHDGELARLFSKLRTAPSTRKSAKRLLCALVDELAETPRAQVPGKTLVRMAGQDVPVSVAAIEHARLIVEREQRLPTKGEVQRALQAEFRFLKTAAPSLWPKIWREAGLASLPHGKRPIA